MSVWSKISLFGIPVGASDAQVKRSKLTNRLVFITLCLSAAYVTVFAITGNLQPIPQNAILFVVSGLLVLLLKNGRQHLAALLLCYLLITHVVVISLLIPHGFARLFLIPMAILGFVLISSRTHGILIFLYALVGFVTSEVLKDVIPAFIDFDPRGNLTLELFNYMAIFFGCFFLVFHLKLTSDRYENKLIDAAKELREKHDQLDQSHKEIQASIVYAQRIQRAILPSPRRLDKLMPDHFILYRPKDVVAGDFYWVEKKNNVLYVAAADCTGHGVPGAMVSVICNGALNRSIREFGLSDPGEILNKTRELVIAEFEKSDEVVKDGMDIALYCIDGNDLHYAGAYNPLWVLRNNTDTIEEFLPNRQPVGPHPIMEPFNTTKVEVNSGDRIYVFTDGYIDQFGGEKGRKYKQTRLKAQILNLTNEPMRNQLASLNREFDAWRSDYEQIDDVCVIGVEV